MLKLRDQVKILKGRFKGKRTRIYYIGVPGLDLPYILTDIHDDYWLFPEELEKIEEEDE
jgi:hypothetical protein